MAHEASRGGAASARSSWFDEESNKPVIEGLTRRMETFLEALADGRIEDHEVRAQEERLVKIMREVEPQLTPELHDKVTQLLCELTAYDLMQVMNSMQQSRPRTVFRG
jgi:hypothetical protein